MAAVNCCVNSRALRYEYVILPETATPTGAVESLADAQRCARLFQQERDRIDGIVVCLPNFGDELGIVNALKLGAPRRAGPRAGL